MLLDLINKKNRDREDKSNRKWFRKAKIENKELEQSSENLKVETGEDMKLTVDSQEDSSNPIVPEVTVADFVMVKEKADTAEKKLRAQENDNKQMWNLILNSYSDESLSQALISEKNFGAWFRFLKVAVKKFLVILTVKDTPGSGMPESIVQEIRDAGFKNFRKDLWNSYIGVIHRGKVVFDEVRANEEKLSYRYESLEGNLSIAVVSEPWRNGNKGDIRINDVQCSVNIRGVNIVIYDTVTRHVVDSVGYDSHESGEVTFRHNQQLSLGLKEKKLAGAQNQGEYYVDSEQFDFLKDRIRNNNNLLKKIEKSINDNSKIFSNSEVNIENVINKKTQELIKSFEKKVLSDIYGKFCLLTNLVAGQKSDCLVSIVIPVYNVERYLKDTLFSIINQNFSSWEMICVDDCSTDGSTDILDTFSKLDPRITVIHLSENSGAGYARNIGLSRAKGEYLAILDADDIYDQNYLRSMVYSAVNTGADITVCRSNKMIEADNNRIEAMPWSVKKDMLPKSKIFRPCNFNNYVFQSFVGWSWDKLFKKDFIERNELKFQEIRSTNDAYFVYMALCYANTIATIDDPLVIHRYHNSSLAATRKVEPSCFATAIRAIYDKLKSDDEYWNYFNQSFLNWVIDLSYWHYSTIDEDCKSEIISEFKKLINDLNIFEDVTEIYNENMLSWIMANDISISSVPYVSIIVPLYNQENYLRECLDSLINQTLKNIEIIIVNDGSTDSSLAIAREYKQNDERIKLIDKANSGYGDTMNIGIEAATGQYIGIVEPDDFIDLTMYEELYKKARCKNLDLIKSDFYRFVRDDNGEYKFDYIEIDRSKKFYNKVLNPEDNLDVFRLVMNTWSGIYKTEFIRKFNIKHNVTPGASFQDNGFWFQTFCNASRVYFYNKAFYKNRRDNENSSVKSKGKVYCFSEEYHFIHDFLDVLEPEKRAKFMKPFFLKLFHNYNFNLCRIDESFREEFAKYASYEFKSFVDSSDFDDSMFSELEKSKLSNLILDYNQYLNKMLFK